jgi:DDE superfamily endonuclease
MRKRAPSGISITTPRATRPVSPSWRAGPYQWIAQLGFARDSWVAPMDVVRVQPKENANEVAAEQVKGLLHRLPEGEEEAPLFVFDAGYNPVQLQQGLEGCHVQILVRLRAGRCFYADPPPPKRTGRPSRHGQKLDCKDPETWPAPSAEHRCEDSGYGSVRVRAWASLHPKTQDHPTRGTRRPRPIVRGTLVLVEVTRLPRPTREPRALWLWWAGGFGEPDLDLLWRAYVRRFDLEHTFRFLKQTLGWTTPRVRHPEQADRWSWLVLAAFTQLRLARPCVADRRLPWERHYSPGSLTPHRVRRVISALLVELGTPAKPPNPADAPRVGPRVGVRAERSVPGPQKDRLIRIRESPKTFCKGLEAHRKTPHG